MHIFRKFRALLLMALIILVLGSAKTGLAADVILKDLNGQAVNLSSAENKPAILFFWTTWCSYCRKEIKGLNQLYSEMKKEGITVFAVNIGESDYKVQGFFKDYVLNFNVLLDKEGKLADQYDVIGVPTYILLNKSGHRVAHGNALPADYRNLLLK
ncbi:MAG: TlpA disulfide reductase family protein [Candidatus Omnitrophota bacterium]